jgi:hypothetical protein
MHSRALPFCYETPQAFMMRPANRIGKRHERIFGRRKIAGASLFPPYA